MRSESSTKRAVVWRHWHPELLTAFLLFVVLGVLWLCYGLSMRNRALAWESRNPSQPGPVGWLTKALPSLYSLLLPCGLMSFEILSGLFKRAKRKRILTGRRINGWWILAFGTIGISLGLLATYIGMKTIDYYLWSNQPAVELQRKAEVEQWLKLNKLYPDHHFARPTPAVSQAWLAVLLVGGFILCWSAVSFVRKVVNEYLFVMFASAEEEQREKAMALMGSQVDDKKSFRVEPASHRTVHWVSILSAAAGAAIMGLFVLSQWLEAEYGMMLILPTATTLAALFTIAIGLMAVWRNRNLQALCLLTAAASTVGLAYLGTHYELALDVVGAALGIFWGMVLVVQLRNSSGSKKGET